MKSQVTLSVLFFTVLFSSCENTKKEEYKGVSNTKQIIVQKENDSVETSAFESTVYKVIEAFRTKNADMLKDITSTKGVIVLYRTGVFNEYTRINKVDFNDPVPGTFPYPVVLASYNIKFETLPEFNCGNMEWNKYGLYCDTIRKDTLLSGAPLNLKKYRGDNIPDAEINAIKELERKSRRIVLADKQQGDLIFYLTLIDNKWQLTAIDRITTDCSA